MALRWLEFPLTYIPLQVLNLLLYHHHDYSLLPDLKIQSFLFREASNNLNDIVPKAEGLQFSTVTTAVTLALLVESIQLHFS